MAIKTEPFIELIAQAEQGFLQLPEFQRPWKWGPQNVMKLFDSVRQGYPIGAFLLMERNDHVQITPRPFFKGEATEIAPQATGQFILDGQQRLTAGLILFSDKGKSRYYVDLDRLYQRFSTHHGKALADINASELSGDTAKARAEFLSDLDSDDEYCVRRNRTLDPMALIEKHLLATAFLRDDEKLPIVLAAYKRKHPERFPFIEYVVRDHFVLRKELQIPVTVVEKDRPVEAICRIFSTLNTTGRPLTPFELVVAILYPQGIRLRDELDALRDLGKYYANMDASGEVLLQTIALLANDDPKKAKLPETITAARYREHMDDAFTALEDLGEFLSARLGVGLAYTPNLVPYDSVFAPMAVSYREARAKLSGATRHAAEHKLERWFVLSALDRRYQEGVHNKQREDVKDFRLWAIEGGQEPSWIRDFRTPSLRSDSATGARPNLIRCLINRGGPRDVVEGEMIGFREQAVATHSHHFFPMAYCRQTLKAERPDLALNIIMTSQTTNTAWASSNPYDQITQAIDKRGITSVREELRKQFVHEDAFALLRKSPLTAKDFEGFMVFREKAILGALSEWGVAPTPEAAADEAVEEDED